MDSYIWIFADKEVEDDGREEECCFPIREIPVAKPPPRPKAPKPKPKMKYNPPPEYWPQPGTWSDSSSSDDNDEESSSWSDGSLSDESCSDDDGGGGNKLWFWDLMHHLLKSEFLLFQVQN